MSAATGTPPSIARGADDASSDGYSRRHDDRASSGAVRNNQLHRSCPIFPAPTVPVTVVRDSSALRLRYRNVRIDAIDRTDHRPHPWRAAQPR